MFTEAFGSDVPDSPLRTCPYCGMVMGSWQVEEHLLRLCAAIPPAARAAQLLRGGAGGPQRLGSLGGGEDGASPAEQAALLLGPSAGRPSLGQARSFLGEGLLGDVEDSSSPAERAALLLSGGAGLPPAERAARLLMDGMEALSAGRPSLGQAPQVAPEHSLIVVAPEDCQVMVGFNHRTAGPEAVQLTQLLNECGFATFCTDVYCPGTAGNNWRTATIRGVMTCRVFIPLMTHGWQKSAECVWETERAINRHAKREIVIIPVEYEDFDDAYDSAGDMFKAQIGSSTQFVFHSNPNWMESILRGVRRALQ